MKAKKFVLSLVFGVLISLLMVLEIAFTPLNALFIPFGFNGADIVFLFLSCALTILFYKLSVREIAANLFIILGVELVLFAPIVLSALKLGWLGDIGLGFLSLASFLIVVAVPGFFVGLVLLSIGIFTMRKSKTRDARKSF